ncbi:hypothetical protein BO94DRAFT_590420 [Aspergillus sclerotioniger CBS 115572]|uniref:Uncharacterized protein n=1 Tax=Aspergillus sclerotioniger CBS 115572 TaxID=1450535 RepID=A0A317V9G6_9EURO|nr:hypothetical protein BO94DRAFT_590420 [Aspergillus sclerotioniger CBS 115572]PWY69637.1 hypothetical protein BO94DRAFT_590420 [Aspergillus sclerotioniger CBS 115572]
MSTATRSANAGTTTSSGGGGKRGKKRGKRGGDKGGGRRGRGVNKKLFKKWCGYCHEFGHVMANCYFYHFHLSVYNFQRNIELVGWMFADLTYTRGLVGVQPGYQIPEQQYQQGQHQKGQQNQQQR